MLAGLCRGGDELGVPVGLRADDDALDLRVGEDLVEARRDPGLEVRGAHLRPLGVVVPDPLHLDVRSAVEQPHEARGVDVADADEGQHHLAVRTRARRRSAGAVASAAPAMPAVRMKVRRVLVSLMETAPCSPAPRVRPLAGANAGEHAGVQLRDAPAARQ